VQFFGGGFTEWWFRMKLLQSGFSSVGTSRSFNLSPRQPVTLYASYALLVSCCYRKARSERASTKL